MPRGEEKQIARKQKRPLTWIVTIVVILLAVLLAIWYTRLGSDPTPDSPLGFGFAITGTTMMLLAALGYSLYRRSRKRGLGQLNGSLNWHIAFAVIAFALLLLHSFGNFNPRSGTYALYAMIAMVISGFIGRMLDKIMPRLITGEVNKALTTQGEDRLESITQQLHTMVEHNTQELRAFNASQPVSSQPLKNSRAVPAQNGVVSLLATNGKVAQAGSAQPLQTSWDLAYISLEELPQEVQQTPQYRFVPDRKSELAQPGALIPGMKDQLQELHRVEHALQREQVFRYIIRYWRVLHVCLAVVTVGLTAWHIEFALSLLIPVWLHH